MGRRVERCCWSSSSSPATALASAARRLAVSGSGSCCAGTRRLRTAARRLRTRLMVFSRARRTGFTTCASGSSGSRSWVGRVEVERSRRYLKKFSCDQRENMAPATCRWVGGDHWHLATVGETAPDLADREPVAQYYRLLGEVNGCGTGSSGPMDQLQEILLRPVLPCQVMQAMPRRARRLNRSGLPWVVGERRHAGVRPGRGPLPAPPPGAAGAAPRPARWP